MTNNVFFYEETVIVLYGRFSYLIFLLKFGYISNANPFWCMELASKFVWWVGGPKFGTGLKDFDQAEQ